MDLIGLPYNTPTIFDYNMVTRRVKPLIGSTDSRGDVLTDAVGVHIDNVPDGASVSLRLRTNKSRISVTAVTQEVPLEYDSTWDIWRAVVPEEVLKAMRYTSADIQVCVESKGVRELSFNMVRMRLNSSYSI